jgi:hypothetical protein
VVGKDVADEEEEEAGAKVDVEVASVDEGE